MDTQGCFFFIVGKMSGTIFCLLSISLLFRYKYRYASVILGTVTAFQIALLIFLLFSDPRMHGLPNFSLLFGERGVSIWDLS